MKRKGIVDTELVSTYIVDADHLRYIHIDNLEAFFNSPIDVGLSNISLRVQVSGYTA